MWMLLIESIIIGIITFVIGTFIFNLSIDKNKPKPENISFTFFITGVVIHIFFEIVGINKWYCDKKLIYGYTMLSSLSK